MPDITIKILKENVDLFSTFMLTSATLNSSTFPLIFKLTDVTPVYQNNSRYQKSNYRLVSVLLNLSNVFENILYKQFAPFFEKTIFKNQTDFQKGFNPQTCLVVI